MTFSRLITNHKRVDSMVEGIACPLGVYRCVVLVNTPLHEVFCCSRDFVDDVGVKK